MKQWEKIKATDWVVWEDLCVCLYLYNLYLYRYIYRYRYIYVWVCVCVCVYTFWFKQVQGKQWPPPFSLRHCLPLHTQQWECPKLVDGFWVFLDQDPISTSSLVGHLPPLPDDFQGLPKMPEKLWAVPVDAGAWGRCLEGCMRLSASSAEYCAALLMAVSPSLWLSCTVSWGFGAPGEVDLF